jgi:PAS domain S-box-containing protein
MGSAGKAEPSNVDVGQLTTRLRELEAENASLRAMVLGQHDEAPTVHSLQYLRALLEAVPYGISFHDGKRIFLASARLARMFGYDLPEIMGRDPADFVAPEARPILEAKIASRSEEAYESVGIRKNGSRFPVEFAAREISSGDLRLRMVLIRDLTQQKEADVERTLALRASRMGTWTCDLHSGRVTWSHALEEIFGLRPGEFAGTEETFFAFIHPDDRELAAKTIAKATQGGEEYRFDFRFIRADGEIRWMEGRGQAFSDRIVGVGIDITERKQAEDHLIGQAQELARSNSDLQQFAYIASHDLQEPLRMVCNYGQLLQARYKDRLGADADEFIGFMVAGAQRMSLLVHDLLAYSRISSADVPEHRPVDLTDAVRNAMRSLETSIDENSAEIDLGRLPVIHGDEVGLMQLFENLISNSIKYRSADPPRVSVDAAIQGSEWTVSVKDNGIGIDPRYHERIFGLFKRLHGHNYPGTGLGLAICRRVVERHSGRIWVESQPGQGATFFCTFPVNRSGNSP